MKNWNKNEWQGRTKSNVEFSTGVASVSLIIFVILLLSAAIVNSQTNYNKQSDTPITNVWKNSDYNKQKRFTPQRMFLNNNRLIIIQLPENTRNNIFYSPVVYRPYNRYDYVYRQNLINYGYYLQR